MHRVGNYIIWRTDETAYMLINIFSIVIDLEHIIYHIITHFTFSFRSSDGYIWNFWLGDDPEVHKSTNSRSGNPRKASSLSHSFFSYVWPDFFRLRLRSYYNSYYYRFLKFIQYFYLISTFNACFVTPLLIQLFTISCLHFNQLLSTCRVFLIDPYPAIMLGFYCIYYNLSMPGTRRWYLWHFW